QELRLGLRLVKGLSLDGAQRVYEARRQGVFRTVPELVERCALNSKDREALAAADALQELVSDRHRAFWEVAGYEEELPLFAAPEVAGQEPGDWLQARADEQAFVEIMLPRPTEAQNIIADYVSTGLTLRRHPLALLRSHLQRYRVVTAAQLPQLADGSLVKVVGIVTSRQRPQTASGVTFMTLEDESGFLNVVVWSTLSERHRLTVREALLLGVSGRVQISEGVVHVLAGELVDLSSWLAALELRSRDFC
ncbi:MAG: OB-fold nucleic acid binding domain-containing protein, partial [Gammaproteobacteria bacterium]|nr:OB-fold nucleic acid binding domain-containing protein [Gammaproteobacteria bacterium]